MEQNLNTAGRSRDTLMSPIITIDDNQFAKHILIDTIEYKSNLTVLARKKIMLFKNLIKNFLGMASLLQLQALKLNYSNFILDQFSTLNRHFLV